MQPVTLAHRRRFLSGLKGAGLWLGIGGLTGGGLSACATWFRGEQAPLLRLDPASLGRELGVVQRMEIEAGGQVRAFDAALEVDADGVRLVLLQMGQTIARLDWDGRVLTQSLPPGWPKVVAAESVLSDLQYVWWPRDRIQAALPAGWVLDEGPGHRVLRHGGDNVVLTMRAIRPGTVELTHRGAGYVVRLQSQGAQPAFVSP